MPVTSDPNVALLLNSSPVPSSVRRPKARHRRRLWPVEVRTPTLNRYELSGSPPNAPTKQAACHEARKVPASAGGWEHPLTQALGLFAWVGRLQLVWRALVSRWRAALRALFCPRVAGLAA